ncbi:RGS1-HXK1-interacting protein 1 isoform X2 [Dendrobium catenatum]|uniref:RGS1-HXK1-interacting protein 1 isoform X2 n=1 Tax=Dendrobium catenatum TaxID=906689 RepID=UPI0010A09277|nr:RGS1-HXK1-interacting protein 1 isoform X2 [Dendrobium catenatum]
MYPDPASHPPLPPSSPPRRSPDHGERSASEVRGSAPESFFSPQENSFWPLQKLQGIMHEVKLQYKAYEDAAVQKVKDGFVIVTEHPAAASGAAIFSGLLLMRGPRRFLWRQTLWRFQSEEGYVGCTAYILISTGLCLSLKDVIDGLRVIPGRDALKLRAEIASMTSDLRQQRRDLDRKILKISEHGIPV